MILDWNIAFDQCWRCSAMLAVVMIAAGMCRRMPLTRQAILQLGLIGLAVLPLTMLLPKLVWGVLPALQTAVTEPEITLPITLKLVSQKTSPRRDVNQTVNNLDVDDGREQGHVKNGSPLLTSIADSSISVNPTRQHEPVLADALGIDSNSAEPQSDSAQPLISTVFTYFSSISFRSVLYLTGILVMCGRLAIGLRNIRLLHRNATCCHDEKWLNALQHCRTRLKIQRTILLCSASTLTTPLTFGWLRPILVVPVSLLEQSTPAEREVILLHELTHIQRHDFAWMILLHLVQALYWFHPLMWWFGRGFRICVAEFGARSYSETLVNVARLVRQPSVLTLGLAMSRSLRLSHRLTRIQRHGGLSMSRMSAQNWCVVLALAVPLGIALMFLEPARAQQAIEQSATDPDTVPNTGGSDANSPTAKPVPAPEVMPHVVIQIQKFAEKTPLASTAINVRRVFFEDGRFPTFAPETIEVVSDASGLVKIPLKGIGPEVKEVLLEIIAKDCATEAEEFVVRRTAEPLEPKVLRVRPGLKLTTHVFDAEGQPITDACVSILADVSEKRSDTWHSYCRGDATGLIEFHVPRDKVFGFIVKSDHGAPYRIVCSAGTQELSDIHLQRGCTVFGQLLDRNARPVPDCTVHLEGEDSEADSTEYEVMQHGGGGSLDLQSDRKTDAEGRFRFSPMVGPVRVYLDWGKVGKPPQMIIPVSLDLPENGEKWSPLMLAPVGRITGTVRWPDGKPVPKVHFELLVPPNLSNSYINLSQAKTDDQGNYSLDVPFPLEEADISGSVVKGPDGKYWQSRPAKATPGTRGSNWFPVKRYLGETLTVDWTMISPEQQAGKVDPAPAMIEPKWQPLAKLEQEIEAANRAYDAAVAGDAGSKLDPRIVMVERCLAFEAEHRGSRLAIGAMHYVMRAAATTTYGVPSEARAKAIAILDQHYLKHPDLDLLIDEFDAGSSIATGETLLTHATEQSPFDYVRAAALFHLAELRLNVLEFAENIDNIPLQSEAAFELQLKIQNSESAREWLRNNRAEDLRQRAAIKQLDLVQLRFSAMELLDRIVNNYSTIKTPRRQWENTMGRERQTELKLVDSRDTWRILTIPEQAALRRFQQTRLRPGMPAPEIEGVDFHQRPIRLSQFKGQIVLLAVGVGNSETELCTKCNQVVAALKGRPFQCISIVSGDGSGGYSVRSIVEDKKITCKSLVRYCQSLLISKL
jgi:beta-lactamase regulating signal transducer with metallopeptidase domain